ncbi:hypothetical protein CPLU01_08598 [Colletotrichum plurivorum]|uniref:Uncharacterized protein n=1 Tax=Colletotrichum plurivorum TaxID=2175906 RepID=A0A8H6KCB7_9PEZI|nr:hypothetical protein CPLU01_08598 [Colletotrichum plurivorum]
MSSISSQSRLFLLQAFEPTDKDTRGIYDITRSIAGSYRGKTRTTCVFYTSTDIFRSANSPTAVIEELQNVFRKNVTKTPTQYFIGADEYTSWMVKEIYLRGLLKDLRKGMTLAGFFYTEWSKDLHDNPSEKPATIEAQLPGLGAAFLMEVFLKFDKACIQGARQLGLLQCIPVGDHPHMKKDNVKNIRNDLERALNRWIPLAFAHTSVATASPLGSFWADLSSATALLYLGHLGESRYKFNLIRYEVQEAIKHAEADLESLLEVEEDATFPFASPPFYLGSYDEILDIIVKKPPQSKSGSWKRHCPKSTLRSIGVDRLKALSIAFLGFLDNMGDDPETRILAAQEKLDRLRKRAILDNSPQSATPGLAKDKPKPVHDGLTREFTETEISLWIAQATISMLRGDYHRSFSLFDSTLPKAIQLLGETNPLTLQAALYTCRLQLVKSQVTKASALANGVIGIVSKQFGPKSLLMMEAAYVIVSVHQAEGRLVHALDASLQLCAAIDSGRELEPAHLISLRCRLQLGKLQILCGRFRDAENTLEVAFKISESTWQSTHPTTLRLQSELALSQYHLGKIYLASQNISSALRKQLQACSNILRDQLWQEDDGPTESLKHGMLSKIRKAFHSMNGGAQSRTLHPDILDTLLIFGKIEATSKYSDQVLVAKVFHLVWEMGRRMLGISNELKNCLVETYGYYFDFVIDQGVVFDLNSANYKSNANRDKLDDDETCETKRGKLRPGLGDEAKSAALPFLGMHHPTILRARQEMIAAEMLEQGGPGSLMTLMMLQFASKDSFEDIVDTGEELLHRLGKEEVRGQRLFSCLKFEECLAHLLITRVEEFDQEKHATEEDDLTLKETLTEWAAQCQEALFTVGIKGERPGERDFDEFGSMDRRSPAQGL